MSEYIKQSNDSIPFLLWIILLSTLISGVFDFQIFNLSATGYSWVLPTILSLIILAKNFNQISFPLKVWLPWVFFTLIYLSVCNFALIDFRVNPLQRTLQVLAPILIASACSTFNLTLFTLQKIRTVFFFYSFIFVAGVIASTSLGLVSYSITGTAGQSIFALFFSIYFSCLYINNKNIKNLFAYVFILILPFLAITRSVLFASLLSPAFSFFKLSIPRRIFIILTLILIAFSIFNLPQIQQKMFYSGSGNINDVGLENSDFQSNGRLEIWTVLFNDALNNFWFGKGIGEAQSASYSITSGIVGYPHNDWLLLFFDYGIVGVIIFLVTNIVTLVKLTKIKKLTNIPIIHFYVNFSASTYLPFFLLMCTDNILVYNTYFGNIQYAIIGICFSFIRSNKLKNIK